MSGINIHFIHGFLGEPSDWSQIIDGLPEDWHFHCHSLIDQVDQINDVEDFFSQWALQMSEKVNFCHGVNILVGYSLGGRLCMHIDPKVYQKMVLISSHPGLLEGRQKRLNSDQQWLIRAQGLSFSAWMQEWNQQAVFSGDDLRPQRDYSDDQWEKHLVYLQKASLGYQQWQGASLKDKGQKVYWAFGGKDEKFASMAEHWLQWLPENQVRCFQEAGHGLIFSHPYEVAQWLRGVVESVE